MKRVISYNFNTVLTKNEQNPGGIVPLKKSRFTNVETATSCSL